MTADQIKQTLTTVATITAPAQRSRISAQPTISIGGCNTPGCTCCTKGGKR